jgi:hypothetical protein
VTWSIFPAIAIRNAAAPIRIIKVQIPIVTSIELDSEARKRSGFCL